MEENNNELAIEMPALKAEHSEQVPIQNTVVEAATPVLSEKMEEPIVMPVATPVPETNSVPVVEQSVPVTLEMPVAPSPVVEQPAVQMSVVPEVPVTPISVPETPVTQPAEPVVAPAEATTQVETPVVEAPVVQEVQPVVNPTPVQAPVAPEVTPVANDVTPVTEAPVAPVTQEVQPDPEPTPAVPVNPVKNTMEPQQVAQENVEPEIKKASKTAQLIGTVVLLVITGLIVFWLAKRYFVL